MIMTDTEFADAASNCAALIENTLIDVPPQIAWAGCIEAACNMAIRAGKAAGLAVKFREVADLLETES